MKNEEFAVAVRVFNFYLQSLVVNEQITEGACCRCYVLYQVDVALFAVQDDAAIVHVVLLAAGSTGGNGACLHGEAVLGVGVGAVLTDAVGALQVVGHETAIGRLVECLIAHDDAVVDADDVGCALFEGALLLLGRHAHVVREIEKGGSAAGGLADLTEDSPRVGIHGRGQGGIKEGGILVGEVAGLAAVFILCIAAA